MVLLLLYMVTVPGFALNVHYCGKIVTSVKIDAPAKGCKSSLMTGKMKCCHDKHIDVKVKDAHQGKSHSFLAKVFSFQLTRIPFSDYLLSAQKALLERFFEKGPSTQPFDNIPVFLKNCTFRF